jgi:hypothetical protein
MAATVELRVYTGTNAATEDGTDRFAGTVRFRANDSAATDAANPVVKGAGTVYSMEKWLRMKVTGGTFTSLTNPKFYTNGTGWGTGLVAAVRTTATGATPTTPASLAGFTNSTTYVTGSRLNLGTYTVSTPNPLGDFLVGVLEVQNTAAAGVAGSGASNWTFAYDEV